MDRAPKKDQPNNPLYPGTLAQPLELKQSLKIRDGLGKHDVSPVQWLQFKAISPDLGDCWMSNN